MQSIWSRISLFALIAFISCATCAVPMYKYGPGARDRRLPNSANPAVTIFLPENYIFYGVEYKHICVSHCQILICIV